MNLETPLIQLDGVSKADGKFPKPLFSAISPPSNNKIPFVLSAIPPAQHGLLVPEGALSRRKSASDSEGLSFMEAARRMPDARAESLCSSPRINHYTRTQPNDPYAAMKSVTGASLSASYTSGSGSMNSLRPKMFRNQTVDTPTISKYEGEEYDMVNQYKVLDIIGHGSYGIVHKVADNNQRTFAMKIVGKRRLRRKSFPVRGPRGLKAANDPLDGIRKEIAILKKLSHPNVVHLVEVLDDPNEDDLILVFEYIHDGAVMESISPKHRMSEVKARHHFIDLILGLEYLHAHKVIHRDIKPENLLLDNDILKIADFGVSEQWTTDTSDVQLNKSAGTPAFTAPEALDPTKPEFGGKALDIWAAGVTLYCFMFGKVPFTGKGIADLHEKIRKQEVIFPADTPISPDLCNLLTRLLEKDPAKRITIAQIREHPWIKHSLKVMPSVESNCRDEIAVTEEEVKQAVKSIRTPIHILVMIKNMAQKKSLKNPYSVGITKSPSPSPSPRASLSDSLEAQERRETFASRRTVVIEDSPPSSQ